MVTGNFCPLQQSGSCLHSNSSLHRLNTISHLSAKRCDYDPVVGNLWVFVVSMEVKSSLGEPGPTSLIQDLHFCDTFGCHCQQDPR